MDRPPRKLPRKISKSYLENAALYYLQRYATSSENLRRVLMRKIERSCQAHGQSAEDFIPLVEDMMARYLAAGLLDDRAYAEARTSSLRRQGLSRRGIGARLAAKGLSAADIARALAQVDARTEEDAVSGNAELDAARAFVRRKKLGPCRTRLPADPAKALQKDLAALARAGFSYEIAREALEQEDEPPPFAG